MLLLLLLIITYTVTANTHHANTRNSNIWASHMRILLGLNRLSYKLEVLCDLSALNVILLWISLEAIACFVYRTRFHQLCQTTT